MTPQDAANSLYDRLHDEPWFNTVGLGVHEDRPAIYLYVKTTRGMRLPFARDEWEGFKVLVKKMGSLHPA